MKMVRLLIQVPEPIKARLDALRRRAPRRADSFGICWSSILVRTWQQARKDGEGWHERGERIGACWSRRILPASRSGMCGSITKAGIDGATWHDLRHTFASRLAMTGHNEGTIAALLRHSTTVLVKRYAHLSPSHLKVAVEGGCGTESGA